MYTIPRVVGTDITVSEHKQAVFLHNNMPNNTRRYHIQLLVHVSRPE